MYNRRVRKIKLQQYLEQDIPGKDKRLDGTNDHCTIKHITC